MPTAEGSGTLVSANDLVVLREDAVISPFFRQHHSVA
jgi:hypothetical protein